MSGPLQIKPAPLAAVISDLAERLNEAEQYATAADAEIAELRARVAELEQPDPSQPSA